MIDRLEQLSPRQCEVLELIALGQCNKEIAHDLGISEGRVKDVVREILHKLEVPNRAAAAAVWAARRGLK